ncbi:uncharacterized protein LOC110719247 [Chenopodium quinoa]|uniref:uncharacterized protein LOC110719247 n=1 Tax=Chenopodium quinoa TaxID=63459 RepID=UPI000B774079|nr:uncharacterized protein LOC110719247 [Chenopodium quinoa]
MLLYVWWWCDVGGYVNGQYVILPINGLLYDVYKKECDWLSGVMVADGDISVSDEEINMEYVRRIKRVEVEIALKKMTPKKAVDPDGIPMETSIIRYGGLRRIPQDWRKSTLVPVYKNKRDAQGCSNYQGIKLMSPMKLWERVIEHRLRACTNISDNQFGFMPGRSTMEAFHLIRQMMEFYRVKKKDIHMVFIDLEKAYDKVPREVLWWAMLKKGSALSPFLFATVLDEITRLIQDKVPWCMLFADDVVLVDETKDGVNDKLEKWRQRLESRGFKLVRSKTEYLVCRFGTQRGTSNEVVSLDGKELTMSECLSILGRSSRKMVTLIKTWPTGLSRGDLNGERTWECYVTEAFPYT